MDSTSASRQIRGAHSTFAAHLAGRLPHGQFVRGSQARRVPHRRAALQCYRLFLTRKLGMIRLRGTSPFIQPHIFAQLHPRPSALRLQFYKSIFRCSGLLLRSRNGPLRVDISFCIQPRSLSRLVELHSQLVRLKHRLRVFCAGVALLTPLEPPRAGGLRAC